MSCLCLCLCLGATPATCFARSSCFSLLPLSLPLETIHTFYPFCSNFLHAIDRPLCFYSAGARVRPCTPPKTRKGCRREGQKHNCLQVVPLPLCCATHMCWVFEYCVFLLLRLPLETFYALCAFSTSFLYAIARPLCFYGARAMPAPLYPTTHSQWL